MDVDRAALIELLNRLGSDDDATVLDAARSLHRKVAEFGLSWDDLLRLDRSDDDATSDNLDESTIEAASGPDDSETVQLIERLLRKDVSADLREELDEMKRQLAAGSLDPDDRRYLRALAKRLGV